MTLTSPEQSAHNRQIKRYTAALMRDGLCRACVHRDRTLDVWHCMNNPGRQRGACQDETTGPKFQTRPNVLEEFADAA
jgi:hypothetical protein